MRSLIKTWLTVCLLLPLAAHATNREQRLPSGFTGHSAKTGAERIHDEVVAQDSKPSLRQRNHREHRVSPQTVATRAGSHPLMPAHQSSSVLSRAVNVLGTPYRWGGSSPTKGFDCSGLVKYAFNDSNVKLPRTSNAMARSQGVKIDQKDLKPGDLIFFNIKSRRVNHVAIYLGNDRFIHAPRRGKSVSIDNLNKPYWQKHYVVAKRVLPKDAIASRNQG